MAKYQRSSHQIPLRGLPLNRVRLRIGLSHERVWVRQGVDFVVLMNDSLLLNPIKTWGMVLPSDEPEGSECEVIDVGHIRSVDDITLHSDAWKRLVTAGVIGFDGTPLESGSCLVD